MEKHEEMRKEKILRDLQKLDEKMRVQD